EVDAWALRSHRLASEAWNEDKMKLGLVSIFDRNGLLLLDRDECLRPDIELDQLSRLGPAFAETGKHGFDQIALRKYPHLEGIEHVHTTGNIAERADGAALLLIGNREEGKEQGLRPRARIVSGAGAAADATLMFAAPSLAVKKALKLAGMKKTDIGIWECDETFAAVALKFQRDLDIPEERLNVNGGTIATGHAKGATGAILLAGLLDEMENRDIETGCVALSASGGLAVATIVERA
ncbi:MAG: acetyl-CoA C-acyltransferase, partial [Saprospiraceae bacterium]|nr:acetyl-CoA C-acyltransferase [Saprospiraceae bacterium]